MNTFAMAAWETNKIADENCKELHAIDISKKLGNKKRFKHKLPRNVEKKKNKRVKIKRIKPDKNEKSKRSELINVQFKRKPNISLNNVKIQRNGDRSMNYQNIKKPKNQQKGEKSNELIKSPNENLIIDDENKSKSSKIYFDEKPIGIRKPKRKDLSLRQRMLETLKASRFRYLNEQMYTNEGKEAQNYFKNDPDAFKAYHEGYRQQIAKWPLNPLDVVIKSIKKMPENYIVADFGCGEGKLSQSVKQKVHSFDLLSSGDHITACDMANVPLENDSMDVVVFCLSLMGTNLRDYLAEANRVLKMGGFMKVAEVESRFDSVDTFVRGVREFGFTKISMNLSHDFFYFLDFKKVSNCKQKNRLPTISLYPCLYKKR